MYLDRAIEEDKEMVESWKGDAEGMLVFAGLFSASVAALLALSVPNILRNPQDTSNFYLAHIYQQLSTQPNGTQPPIPSSLSESDPTEPYTPPTWGVWVNGLWFFSLVISLTCALFATLLQQWARRYLRVAYPRYTPHKRARIRAFYKNGVEKLQISWAIELLPVLLHISLFLFFAGLSVFLSGIHLPIFKAVTTWIAICVVLYAYLTFLPVIHKDSPYSAPLSALASFCLTGMRCVIFRILRRFQIDPSCVPLRSRDPRTVHLDDFFSHNISKTAEEFAFRLKPNIDYCSLLWIFQSSVEDTDLEKFFEALPRLCDSETGKELELKQGFIIRHKKRLSDALIGLMNRTLSSNLIPDFTKQRRMILCTRVIDSTSLLEPRWILRCVLLGDWYHFIGCFDFVLFVQNWKGITDRATSFFAQCVATLTISIVPDRDERWFQLASGILNVSRSLLHKYIAHGDSILLANVIFVVRRTVQTYSGSKEHRRSDILDASSRTLETVCKLKIGDTLPELQHEFCDLWNCLVDTAQTDPRPLHSFVCKMTLKNIRKLYLALHDKSVTHPTAIYSMTDDRDPVLDDPMSYPRCMIDDHRPSLQILDLQFDEPALDIPGEITPNMTPTPTFAYPSAQPLTFTTPFQSSYPAPYTTLSLPSHYSPPFVDPHSHSAPPLDATAQHIFSNQN